MEAIRPLLLQEIRRFRPNLLIIEEPRWANLLPNVKSLSTKLVYDAHNIDVDLAAQMRHLYGKPWRPDRSGEARRNEYLLVQRVDEVWVCSEIDRDTLRAIYGTHVRTRVVQNAINTDWYQPPGDSYLAGARSVLLLTGDLGYGPNAVAARCLIEDVMPHVWNRIARAKVILCGRSPSAEIREAARRDSRIEVTGWVDDTRPFFRRAHALVVPMQWGSGTRLKILEAFAMGLPVVTTLKGAEGLEAKHGKHLLVGDSPKEVAALAVRLLNNRGLAAAIASAARELVVRRYSWQATEQTIRDAIRQLTA